MKVTKVQTWKMVVANLLAVLMVVMSIAVIAPTAAYAASKPALTKTTLKITEGKKYGLKIKNKIAKSSYKWSTSNTKVAKVNKSGIITAVKKGNATITCKVKAPKKAYTLKCKVTVVKAAKKPAEKVVDNKVNDGSVTNQSQLDAALTGSVSAITIKTTDAVNLTIKAGDYSSKTLVVDAPNADITNEGKFASIEIKQIKSSTWNENTTGNIIKVYAPNGRIIVGDKASVSIEVMNEGAKLALVNNGEVKKVTVVKKAAVEISGTSTLPIPVFAQVAGIQLTTSIPLKLVCDAKIDLVINKGAENTKIQVASLNMLPTITGAGVFAVTVGTGETAQSVLVQATSTGTTSSTTAGGSGGVIGGTSSSTLTFDAALSKLTAVSVNYGNNKTFKLSDENFALIKLALSSDAAAATWAALPSKTYSVNGKQVTLSGNVGDTTKNVTVGGSTYAVTAVNNYTFKVTNANGVSITIDKSADDKAFQLKTSSTLQDVATSKTADKALYKLDAVNSVNATYNGNNYTVECPELTKLAKYVNNEELFYTLWPTIDTKVVVDQNITITGTKGSNTKTVTVDGIAFTATMNADKSVTVTNSSKVNATIAKGSNNIVVTLN